MRKSLLLCLFLPFLSSCVGTITNNIQADTRINASAKVDSRIEGNINANANADIKTGNNSINPNSAKTVSAVTIYPVNNTLLINDTLDLTGNVTYSDSSIDSNIFWISSNSSVIKIDSSTGRLIAVGNGQAIISAISRDDSTKKAMQYFNVMLPYPTATPTANPDYSYYSTPSPSYIPDTTVYEYYDIEERVTFHGKIFNPDGQIVNEATVSAKSIEPGVSWTSEPQITINGEYLIRNAPIGVRIEISVSKDGWTQKKQVVVLRSNLQGDPNANIFDFRGINSIQNEPEITSLKINNQAVTSATLGDYFNTTSNFPTVSKYLNSEQMSDNKYTPSLTGIDADNLIVEMSFSEPVIKTDIEKFFRIQPQGNSSIDKTNSDISFSWADNKNVLIKVNQPLKSNQEGMEYRYSIEFTKPFNDLSENSARTQKYFRFSDSQINDFAMFSVVNKK